MSLAPSMRPKRHGILLPSVLCLFVAANAWWIHAYRLGQPYEIDEAGYLTYALTDLRGLQSGGPIGWVKAIEAPSFQAPLVTAVTSLVYAAMGTEPAWGFATMVLSGALVVAASHALARRIGGTRAATIAALLAATCPTVLNGSRGYNFGLPAAAVMGLALLAMERTRGFRSAGWSVLFGVCVGLLPLTRTMTLAFLPGLALASLLVALRSRTAVRSLLLLCLAGLAALATMAAWFVPNGRYVMDYLLEFGYGNRAEIYGSEVTWDLGRQSLEMLRYLQAYTYLPHLLILLAGLACLLISPALRRRTGSASPLESPLPLAIVTVAGLVALMTSRNKGSAFATPLLLPIFVLAATGLARVVRPGLRAVLVYGAVAIAVLIPAVGMADLRSRLAWPRAATLPLLGPVTLSDGAGNLQRFERAAGYRSAIPTLPVPIETGHEWMEALRQTARRIWHLGGEGTVTALGVRGYLFNANSINLAWMFDGHDALPMIQATPEVLGDTVEAYRAFLLSGDGASSCQLLTATGSIGEIMPAITPETIAKAASDAGFQPADQWPLPDGRVVTLWQRPHSSVPCLRR